MKYAWQKCPNPDVMIFHASVRLPRIDYDDVLGRVVGESIVDDAPVDAEDRALVMAIHDIDGVVRVSMRDYECQIEKGELFDWSDIKPGVVEAFRRRFKPNGSLTAMPDRPSWGDRH